jgi:SAM-dependent methyltransferase
VPERQWADRHYLREVQYKTDANLAARQSVYAYQEPKIDLPAAILDIVRPSPGDVIADVGCGNGAYLAELARGFGGPGAGGNGHVVGADMSPGMLAAARGRGIGAIAPGHLRELRAAVSAASGRQSGGDRVRLDDGEALLRTVFGLVTRHDFEARLLAPPAAVAAYLSSGYGLQEAADQGSLLAGIMSRLFHHDAGPCSVTTHSGILVCA